MVKRQGCHKTIISLGNLGIFSDERQKVRPRLKLKKDRRHDERKKRDKMSTKGNE
jgi:hypothetical protein